MNSKNNRMLASGNQAVAWGVKLSRAQVIPVYPITPQTPILEKITDFNTAGELDAEIITPESEHSAMAASIAASLTGVRVFTATSSQGLLLMHELLHWAAGVRSSVVMFNVNRTIASPWGFWPDQTDSLAQRDTGWIQFYSELAQESMEMVIQAFRIAEQVRLPVMINHDAFFVSHAMESINLPTREDVDAFLPPFSQAFRLDPELGQSVGSTVGQETYRRARMDIGTAMDEALATTVEVNREWGRISGHEQHGVFEYYRCDDAELIIVTMGSMCGTVREAVDAMRDAGRAAGLLKVRLFRPFPAVAIREALTGVAEVLVLDRNYSPGMGGVLHQEIRAALYGLEQAPRIHGYLAGVGGVNVTPSMVVDYAASVSATAPSCQSVWV